MSTVPRAIRSRWAGGRQLPAAVAALALAVTSAGLLLGASPAVASDYTEATIELVKSAAQDGKPLAADASLAPGEAFDYLITVTNIGDGDARTIEITDNLPSSVEPDGDVTVKDGNTVLSTTPGSDPLIVVIDEMKPGAEVLVTIPVQVVDDAKECSSFSNQATVDYVSFGPGYYQDKDKFAESNTVDLSVDCDTEEAVDLSLAKLVNGKPSVTVVVGAQVTYTLTVDNAGPDDATGVVVEDAIPAGVTFVEQTGGDGTLSADGATWTVGDVPADDSASVTFTADVVATGTHTNVAEITEVDQPDTDSTPGNGCEGSTADEDDCAEATVIATEPAGSLAIVKANEPAGVVAFGTIVTYTLSVSVPETDADPQTGVIVTDTIPGYDDEQTSGTTTYQENSAICVGEPPVGGTCDVTTVLTGSTVTGLSWGLGAIAPGETRQVQFQVSLDKQDAVVPNSETVDFVNVAAVSSDTVPSTPSNEVTNTAVITEVSDEELVETGSGLPLVPLAAFGLLLIGLGALVVRHPALAPVAIYRGRHTSR